MRVHEHEPNWPSEVLYFVSSIYDMANYPGSDIERFSWFERSPVTERLRTLLWAREERMQINSVLFRARPGGITQGEGLVVMPYPLADDYNQHPQKPAGRANWHGQACLYCADDKKTAVCETSPHVGDHISLCEFRTKVELGLVNMEIGAFVTGKTIEEQILDYLTWRMAEPVKEMAEDAKYLATQMIGQLCRAEKFDGLSYTSVARGVGKNFAVFDGSTVKYHNSKLITVSGSTA